MKILIPIIIFLLAITSCYYDNQEFLYPKLSASCDTTHVTFTGSVSPILANSCYSCHSNSAATAFGGAIRLQNYSDVKLRIDNGKLMGSVKHLSGFSAMPKGSSPIESCKITILDIWIKAGALNN